MMNDKENLLKLIKKTVNKTDPTARLILYGSYARGDFNEHSDFSKEDVLDLLKPANDLVSKIEYLLKIE